MGAVCFSRELQASNVSADCRRERHAHPLFAPQPPPLLASTPLSCSLHGSAAFKAWQRQKRAAAAAHAAAGLPLPTILLLLLLLLVGGAGVWRATRPAASVPAAPAAWEEAEVVRMRPGAAADPAAAAVDLETEQPEAWEVEEQVAALERHLDSLQAELDDGPGADLAARLDAERGEAAEQAAALEQRLHSLQAELAGAREAAASEQQAVAERLTAAHEAQQRAEAAAAAAASERDAAMQAVEAVREQLAEAQRQAVEGQAAAGSGGDELQAAQAAAAQAAERASSLEAELQAAMQRASHLEAKLTDADQQAARLISQQAAQQAAADAAATTTSAPAWQACTAPALWERAQARPREAGAAAAAAAGVLVLTAALAAWAGARRARRHAAGAIVDRRQLAELSAALERAQDENEARVEAHKREKAAAEEQAARQLAEAREWSAAAAALAHATAEGDAGSGATPARAPLAARSANNNAGANAGAGAAVLPACKADTPAAWLDLLQQRYRGLAAAAARASASAAEAREEQGWGEDKVCWAGAGCAVWGLGCLLGIGGEGCALLASILPIMTLPARPPSRQASEATSELESLRERLVDARAAHALAAAGESSAKARAQRVTQASRLVLLLAWSWMLVGCVAVWAAT